MNLNYLVIQCNNLENSKAFYEAIGFHPIKEKHGNGLEHYSFKINELIIELYPSKKEIVGNLILGLEIKIEIEEVMQRLICVKYQQDLIKTKDGKLSIEDPDGNKIHIMNLG